MTPAHPARPVAALPAIHDGAHDYRHVMRQEDGATFIGQVPSHRALATENPP
jgi:hypothetical protein